MEHKKLINITENDLIEDLFKGAPINDYIYKYYNDPDSLKSLYYIEATTYGSSDFKSTWIVNDRIFFNEKDANKMMAECMEYTFQFGNIYMEDTNRKNNYNYLLDKLTNLDLNLSSLGISQDQLFATFLNEKNKISDKDREKMKKDYEAYMKEKFYLCKKRINEYNKLLKKKLSKEDFQEKKKLNMTWYEFCYLITYYRFHPDLLFPYRNSNFTAEYNIRKLNVY